jgi:hypothetical protein
VTSTTPGHRRTKAEVYFAAIARRAAQRDIPWAKVLAELEAFTVEEWAALAPAHAEPGPTMRRRLISVVQVLADAETEATR